MGQALYRKYRSKSMSEIIGQEHITSTLEHALQSGRISHAYLFTGPKGVGKTSIARILAHAINDIPYDDDSTHMDIIEIDAASNRRIDEIRELRDKVYVAPTSAKYKVYIIDEVHMLTKEAFNALLKTLEEPPAHVVFILATTDAHKLPETIVSRTQRFTFKPVEMTKVVAHLREIAKTEHIDVSDDALTLLAEHGEGSFRDSISLLDQASNQGNKLELSDVQALLGIPPQDGVNQILDALEQSDPRVLVVALSQLLDQGFQPAAVARQLSQQIRTSLIDQTPGLEPEQAMHLLASLIEVPVAHDPERFLEITLLRNLSLEKKNIASNVAVQSEPERTIQVTRPAQTTPEPAPPARPAAAPKPVVLPKAEVSPQEEEVDVVLPQTTQITSMLDEATWPQVLAALKLKYNTLYGVIRMAQARFVDDETVELAFSFAFHQKRIAEAKNQQIVADIIEQIVGHKVQIVCILVPKSKPTKSSETDAPSAKLTPPPDLANISNIFGGGELLES